MTIGKFISKIISKVRIWWDGKKEESKQSQELKNTKKQARFHAFNLCYIRGGSKEGKGGSSPGHNLLKIIEIIGFCLTTSLHKSNFHANNAHHTPRPKLECRVPVRFSPGSATVKLAHVCRKMTQSALILAVVLITSILKQ